MPTHPLELEVDDIHRLRSRDLVLFMNGLLRLELERLGISRAHLETTSNVTVKDLGIDARLCKVSDNARGWVLIGDSLWQFKSGEVGPQGVKNEITSHSRVIEALKSGATYTMVIGWDYTPTLKDARQKALDEVLGEHGCSGQGRVLVAEDIVSWSRDWPSLVLIRPFNRPVGDLVPFEVWRDMPDHRSTTFVPTTDQAAFIKKLRTTLSKGQPDERIYRIEGRSGVGKTRQVIEALNEDTMRDLVVYAPRPDCLDRGLFSLLRDKPETRCILVIDECDLVSSTRFRDLFTGAGPGVILITIGPGGEGQQLKEGYFFQDRAKAEDLEAIVKEIHRAASGETPRLIANLASGYIRAAVIIARNLAARPDLSVGELIRGTDLAPFLQGLLGMTPSDKMESALKVVALFSAIGFDGEVSNELDAVVPLFGLTPGEARSILTQRPAVNLVQKRGRFRYLSPEILAIRLAGEVWRERRSELLALFQNLPSPESRGRFLQRLASLGDDPETLMVTEELLGSRDFFPNLEAFKDSLRSDLLHYLSQANPRAGISTLERLFKNTTSEELQHFDHGRRTVVWTLEKLAWLRETFEPAAHLLLRLAESENETIGNNATSIWTRLFRLYLSGTTVPIFDRLQVLRCILNDAGETLTRQRLAVTALMSIFEIHVSRMVVMHSIAGRPLPPEWRPTPREDHDGCTQAFQLLEKLAMTESHPLCVDARRLFIEYARGILTHGLRDQVIRLLQYLVNQDQESANNAIRIGEEIIGFDREELTEAQRTQLKEMCRAGLEGSFAVRIRRWLGTATHLDWKEDLEGTTTREHGIVLAKQAWEERHLLDEQWDWLFSRDAHRAFSFFEEIGGLDHDFELESRVFASALKSRNCLPWSSYLLGQQTANRGEEVKKLLDQAEASTDAGKCVLDFVWRAAPTEDGAQRVARMIRSGVVIPRDLEILAFGGWMGRVSLEDAKSIIDALLRLETDEAAGKALDLLHMRMYEQKGTVADFEPEVWEALARAVHLEGTMTEFHWGEMARRVIAQDPVRISRMVLAAMENPDLLISHHDERLKVLFEAAKGKPEEVWNAIGETLLRNERNTLSVHYALRDQALLAFPPDVIIRWIDEQGERGAVSVAELSVLQGELNEVHRVLLSKWGENEDVSAALKSNMLTGGFTGLFHKRFEEHLEWATRWSSDADSAIAKWGRDLIGPIKREMEKWRAIDEEDGIR